MYLAHGTDDAGVDPLFGESSALVSVALVTHLGDDLGFSGGGFEDARLGDGVGQGFLHVNVFAHFDGHQRGTEVGMVGRGDVNGVELTAHFGEHLAIVAVASGAGELLEKPAATLKVHVAQCHDIFTRAGHAIAVALASETDARGAELAATCHEVTKRRGG